MDLTDPRVALNALGEANGCVVGLVVQFDFVSKGDIRLRKQGNWPDRVESFRHLMQVKGFLVELVDGSERHLRLMIRPNNKVRRCNAG